MGLHTSSTLLHHQHQFSIILNRPTFNHLHHFYSALNLLNLLEVERVGPTTLNTLVMRARQTFHLLIMKPDLIIITFSSFKS